ncbi:MAG: molecular chaperone HscC [Neisseria sp.]|uniref:molecular chaperone HscC n=1 Tax=Neisseria sp. TaxID=192066 RepID=UPI0026DB495B|nr:molecular chaperone HscC [Neisseria sp.]MDO4640725.1 molecular chaperone HscC [Neisseria sp.]
MTTKPKIGIDLGTTNSLVAQFIDGETRLIPNQLGHTLTPSVVSIDDAGKILVGLAARERLRTAPQSTASAFKRFMGTDKVFFLGGKKFRAEELSALVLKQLKEDAEAYLGCEIHDIVLTVPAYFNAIQRQATRNAATMAGLNVLRLLNEPTAAGLAYGLQERPDDTRFLIYDLGGGTFDVSVLDYFDGIVQVSASAGDNRLGGEDFLQVLRHCFLSQCKELSDSERAQLSDSTELWQALETAKRKLGEEMQVEVAVNVNNRFVSTVISRNDFYEAAKPLIMRLRQPLERALRDAKLRTDQIDSIILVGGATRMPLIRQTIAQLFKRIANVTINPDEAIARGAAVQAALIERDASVDEVVLTDVMPFSLGIETASIVESGKVVTGRFSPIIERNMPVPISREENFSTISDNQSVLAVHVLQGESVLAKENLELGCLNVRIPPKPAGEVSINIRFSYDINGLLDVDISNSDLSLYTSQTFHHNSANLTEEEVQASLQKLAALKIHPRDQQENIYLLEKGKRLYEEYLGDQRQLIGHQITCFEQVLETQDSSLIRRAQKEFNEFLNRYDGGWLL